MTLWILTLTLFGCDDANTTAPTLTNPTGDCTISDAGGRSCYHSPMAGETYLPDCANPLTREYWRVFAMSETSAYIIPRPDGMGIVYDLCDDTNVGEMMNTYGLCTETLSATEVDIINDIPPADALIITNALHNQLFFFVDENDQISPWAPPNDIVEACNLSDDNDSVVSEYCDTALGYYDSADDCPGLAFEPDPAIAAIIANRLNTLYGLDTPAN